MRRLTKFLRWAFRYGPIVIGLLVIYFAWWAWTDGKTTTEEYGFEYHYTIQATTPAFVRGRNERERWEFEVDLDQRFVFVVTDDESIIGNPVPGKEAGYFKGHEFAHIKAPSFYHPNFHAGLFHRFMGIQVENEAAKPMTISTPNHFSKFHIAVSLWWFLALGLLLPTRPLYFIVRRHRRANRGLCLACGYDLRGSPLRCPECGEPKE